MGHELSQLLNAWFLQKRKRIATKLRQWRNIIVALLVAAILGGITAGTILHRMNQETEDDTVALSEEIVEPEPVIITEAALTDIINISELSTCSAVYKGVATVNNEKKPEKVDYHIKYHATVDAGIDMSQIEIHVDNDLKEIRIILPDATILDYAVQMESLEFMFFNDEKNQLEDINVAYAECERDVANECATKRTILELAKQNAVSIVRALTEPFVEQMNEEYMFYVE